MGTFDRYNTKVGRQVGGDRFFVKDTGYLNFHENDFLGAELMTLMLNEIQVTNYVSSVSTLSVSVFSPVYGYAIISAATGCSKCSIRIDDGVRGARLVVNGAYLVGDANVSLIISGVSCTGIHGSAMSSFDLSAGAYMVFVCTATDVWAVVEQNASVTDHAAA